MKERYELSIDPIDIPEDVIDLFKVDGQWKTNNHKAVDWLCTQIESKKTSLVIDIYEEEDYEEEEEEEIENE